jgi:hypothetical protein
MAGLNLLPFKVVILLTFLIFLWAMFEVSAGYLTWGWRVALLVLIGLQPFIWEGRDDILSDLPFLMFLYLALAFNERFCERARQQPPLPLAFVLGVLLFLPYATRTAGLSIIPAFFLYDLWKRRRLTLFTCAAIATPLFLALAQSRILKTTSGYGGLFNLSPSWLVHNTINYIRSLRVFLVNGYSHPLSYGVFAIALVLAAWGGWRQLRRGLHFLDVFALVYLPLIIAYSVPGLHRYLLPFLPLFFIYVLTGFQALLEALPATLRTPALCAALLLISGTYAGVYAKSERGPIQDGVNDPEFLQTCKYLRDHAAPSDIVIFRKPRVLALLTGLQAAVYNTTGSPETIRAFVHQTHARYIVVASLSYEDFEPDAKNLLPAIERYREAVTEVYTNPHYRIFVLHPDF